MPTRRRFIRLTAAATAALLLPRARAQNAAPQPVYSAYTATTAKSAG